MTDKTVLETAQVWLVSVREAAKGGRSFTEGYEAADRVRERAIQDFKRLGLPAIEALKQILEEGNNRIDRSEAAWMLGQLRDATSVEALAAATAEDEDSEVRDAAAQALASIGGKQVTEVLTTRFQKEQQTTTRQMDERVVVALADSGDTSAADDVLAEFQRKPWAMTYRTPEALAKLAGKRAAGALVSLLGHKEDGVRGGAARVLGAVADASVVEPLCNALANDNDWYVRQAAAESLAKLRDVRAVEPIIAAIARYNVGHKEFAMALGELGDPRAVDSLIGLIREGRGDVIKPACEALARIGDPRAIAPLTALLDRYGVRESGERAINALGGQVPARATTPNAQSTVSKRHATSVTQKKNRWWEFWK